MRRKRAREVSQIHGLAAFCTAEQHSQIAEYVECGCARVDIAFLFVSAGKQKRRPVRALQKTSSLTDASLHNTVTRRRSVDRNQLIVGPRLKTSKQLRTTTGERFLCVCKGVVFVNLFGCEIFVGAAGKLVSPHG